MTPPEDPVNKPGINSLISRYYTVASLASLAVITLTMFADDMGLWAVLPLLLGLVGLVARWRTVPAMILLCIGVTVPLSSAGYDLTDVIYLVASLGRSEGATGFPRRVDLWSPSHLLLAAALLAYMASYHRFLSLIHNVFPPDPRVSRRNLTAAGHRLLEAQTLLKRPVAVPGAWEMPLLVATILIWPLLAFQVFVTVWYMTPWLDLSVGTWRLVALVLGFTAVIVVGALGLWYLRINRYSREEATQVLHEVAWRETRREQSRLQRWLYWGRLRRERWTEDEV